MKIPYRYYNNCVSWPQRDVDSEGGLSDMVDGAIEISRRTFRKHAQLLDLVMCEEQLGYVYHPKQGLTMSGDYHVSYHRGKLHGKRVYFFKHSAIEYIFTERQ